MSVSPLLHKGVVHIPTSYIVDRDNFYVHDIPLESVPLEQTEALRQAILAAIKRGNPRMSRDQARAVIHSTDDPLLRAAGVRSWDALDRQMKGSWSLVERNDVYQIRVDQPMEPHGWQEDKSKRIHFPPGTPIEVVIDRLIVMIQECARG